MIHLAHIITGLNTGGAELSLYKLLSQLDRTEFASKVISLTNIGPVGERIMQSGISVMALDMKRGLPNPSALWRLSKLLSQQHTDVVQTWMYHADFLGGLAARYAGIARVIWNVRYSHWDAIGNKRLTLWMMRLCALTSHWLPQQIVSCSQTARQIHIAAGYAADKFRIIPNGFDVQAFQPNETARCTMRQELGVNEDALLLGLVARFDPLKDHRNFVQAAAYLGQMNPHTHFILCGEGVDWHNSELVSWINNTGFQARFRLLGRRLDIPLITAAFDVATLSSFSEAFPNVVGEAMACGVPCVVTDVGDAAYIVGDTGKVVPPRNPQALAQAWHELIMLGTEGRKQLGTAARQRIIENFNLPDIVKRYEKVWREAAES